MAKEALRDSILLPLMAKLVQESLFFLPGQEVKTD